MDWFERLTGFREQSYSDTKARLSVDRDRLHSFENGKSFGIGRFELASLRSLREAVALSPPVDRRSSVTLLTGDVSALHGSRDNEGAIFQVASQFNMLEMVGPGITPEDGVTRYQHDKTQGPACAIAAGAASIYRNYFVPVGGASGQTKYRQLNGLNALGNALSTALECPVDDLWTMQNGYALCTGHGLRNLNDHLAGILTEQRDYYRGLLQVGIHTDVEVTTADHPGQLVSQIFCSALPVTYSNIRGSWTEWASLVLDAAYEASLLSAVLNARRGRSNAVFLTLLGGGAFGNDPNWILLAIKRSIEITRDYGLDVNIVSYREPDEALISAVNAMQ